jgi:hypothetical protein
MTRTEVEIEDSSKRAEKEEKCHTENWICQPSRSHFPAPEYPATYIYGNGTADVTGI